MQLYFRALLQILFYDVIQLRFLAYMGLHSLGTEKSVSTLSWGAAVLQRFPSYCPNFLFFFFFALKYNSNILMY